MGVTTASGTDPLAAGRAALGHRIAVLAGHRNAVTRRDLAGRYR